MQEIYDEGYKAITEVTGFPGKGLASVGGSEKALGVESPAAGAACRA